VVKDLLAQQSLKVYRAERLSIRSHVSRMHESLRTNQQILLLNDVTPIVKEQTQALSTLNLSQFRNSFRAILSVLLNTRTYL